MDATLTTVVAVIERMRQRRPLVHYMPNIVTAGDVADALLAAGASPVMALAPEEVGLIPRDALALNLGTPTSDRWVALTLAGKAAASHGTPTVVDPVGVGATSFRLEATLRLLDAVPVSVVRLNAGEATALLNGGPAGRGVDAGVVETSTPALAAALAVRFNVVAAVTGATDAVSDGQRTVLIDNGHALLARMTGAGCIATGLVAACAAVEPDAWLASVAGLLLTGVAGERAARLAAGPGTLRPDFLDELANVSSDALLQEGRLRWL